MDKRFEASGYFGDRGLLLSVLIVQVNYFDEGICVSRVKLERSDVNALLLEFVDGFDEPLMMVLEK